MKTAKMFSVVANAKIINRTIISRPRTESCGENYYWLEFSVFYGGFSVDRLFFIILGVSVVIFLGPGEVKPFFLFVGV